MVRNQAQQLFTYLLPKILDLNLPMREEIEVMYVKIVLKPQERLNQKLAHLHPSPVKSQPVLEEKMTTETKEKVLRKNISTGDTSVLSDNDESVATDADAQAAELKGTPVPEVSTEIDNFELDIQLNFLTEVLLSLKPEFIS